MSLLDLGSWRNTFRWVSASAGEHYVKYYDDFYVSSTLIAFIIFISALAVYVPLRLYRGLGFVDNYRRKSCFYVPKSKTCLRAICRWNNRFYAGIEIILGLTVMISWGVLLLMTTIFGKIPFYVAFILISVSWCLGWLHVLRVGDVSGVKKNRYGEQLGARFGIYFDNDFDEEEGKKEVDDEEMEESGDAKDGDKKKKKKLASKREEDDDGDGKPSKCGICAKGAVVTLFWNLVYYYPWGIAYGIWKRWWIIVPGFIVLTVMALILTIFPSNLCISFAPIQTSSSVTRRGSGWLCTWNSICFEYLTVADDLRTNIIVNYQTYSMPIEATQVLYSTNSFDPKTVKLPDVQFVSSICKHVNNNWDEERYQCAGYLSNLQPNSTYYYSLRVKLSGTTDPINSPKIYKFRTAPTNPNTPVRIIAGGMLPWANSDSTTIAQYAAAQEPLLAVINGGMGFDNGCNFCYRKWDNWFQKWQSLMITPEGYSIPLLTVPGSDDTGGWKRPKSDDQFYIQYFPHYLKTKDEVTPYSRNAFHQHTISPHTSFITLDSWVHTIPSEVDQLALLQNFFDTRATTRNKIAVYHGAMYPCRTPEIFMADIIKSMKDYWLPMFDKYKLTVGIEGHFGCYKVTKWLRGNQEASNGTLYIGDGAMGIQPIAVNTQTEFQDSGAHDHVFVIDTSLDGTTITPVIYDPSKLDMIPRTVVRN